MVILFSYQAEKDLREDFYRLAVSLTERADSCYQVFNMLRALAS